MLPSAGTLRITIERAGGELRCGLRPPDPIPLQRFLVGRSPEEAARLVPLIYNICGAAQEAAARSALGLEVSEELHARVRTETLREHVVKLCMVWPPLLGEPAARDSLAHVGLALADRAAGDLVWRSIFGNIREPLRSWSDLAAWSANGETVAARAIAALINGWNPAWGRTDLAMFVSERPVDWPQPTQNGQPVENSPAYRLKDSPLLAEIESGQGHGILFRIAMRLVECAAILNGDGPAALERTGFANAARGAMLVAAETDGGIVRRFERMSPTDFALQPGGVLEMALATLPDDGDVPLRSIAQMIVETVDPCIAVELDVKEDARHA